MVPELVPKELVKEAKEAITACQASSNQDPSLVYVTLIAITALAYYYLKLGQVWIQQWLGRFYEFSSTFESLLNVLKCKLKY